MQQQKRLSCKHRGFTFSAKETKIGDKNEKVENHCCLDASLSSNLGLFIVRSACTCGTVGFTIFPYIVALVHKNSLHVECTRNICNISLIYVEVQYIAYKHNSTMVSDASPGATNL